MAILVFDNYDSFTYNLVHLVKKISSEKLEVHRNDQISLERIKDFDRIILSPGPGIPSEAGLLLDLIKEYASTKTILGVCLGHQAIGQAFGGTLVNLDTVYHGVAHEIEIGRDQEKGSLFRNLPPKILAGRYHSWIVSEENFPSELEITARDQQGRIMALRHREFDINGVQFHPESVLTPDGETIMRNWLNK